ncbi:hypothetical protein LCGC14_0234990 [marine sediment metagenome]|uniref:Uncharacterized protein n=1 Tax=marine sediment metagenome TaxID=412755 RepID=A0A0F9XD10_9ZZZZ
MNARIKTIGEVQRIAGFESTLENIIRIGGLDYELYKANRSKDMRGAICIFDADCGEVADLRTYPLFDQAASAWHETVQFAMADAE